MQFACDANHDDSLSPHSGSPSPPAEVEDGQPSPPVLPTEGTLDGKTPPPEVETGAREACSVTGPLEYQWRAPSLGSSETTQLVAPAVDPSSLLSPHSHHRPPSHGLEDRDRQASMASQASTVSPGSSAMLYEPRPLWPVRDAAEAALLHHFIVHVGPQMDATDPLSHFTNAVTQRAAHCPLLYYAVVSVASIHRDRVLGVPDELSQPYQAECLRILIRFLDDPDYLPDEAFLAAIVVLRKGEEMSDDDRMCHLLGSSRVIDSVGAVAANGGLGEAAAWLVLRQAIYVSLTGGAPLNLNLDCYRRSAAVARSLTDHAWANSMVFRFAETLVFSAKHDDSPVADAAVDDAEWYALMDATNAWLRDAPDTFRPIYEGAARDGAYPSAERSPPRLADGLDDAEPFPVVAMLQAPHVMGLMYYHLTMIMLALTDPAALVRRSGVQSLRRWHETERGVRHHLRRCVGLALGNPHVVASNFEASHILHVCGHCLTDPSEQRASVVFLRGVREKLGWRTDHIIEHLELQWRRES